MPGAEIAGLAIGTIALATLFTTCLELFDCFELGRNYVDDYALACAKLGLLRGRLHTWGKALRVTEPGLENAALREQWSATRDAVGCSSFGLRRLLCDSEPTETYNMGDPR